MNPNESAAVEEAIALNTLEDIPRNCYTFSELVGLLMKCPPQSILLVMTRGGGLTPPEALEAPERPAIKPGKQHLKKLGDT